MRTPREPSVNGWHEAYNDYPGPDVVCGQTRCCESSPRRHTLSHFEQTGHPVMADQSGGEPWGWCLDDLLAGVGVVLSDDALDRIDEIVPPGTDIGTLDQAYVPPAIQKTELRRRPLSERSAA